MAFSVLLLLAGCAEESLFEGIADDQSPQAKRERAQEALDKSDCQTAITLFTELQAEDPNNVGSRLDLSGAYLCQSGFSVQGFLKVASDFQSTQDTATSTDAKEAASDTLFKKITEQVSALIPDTVVWQANVCKSKELLGTLKDDGKPAWPCSSATKTVNGVVTADFFKDNKDAGYLLSIINLADATLTVTDALNALNGVAQCAQTSAQAGQLKCQLTVDDLLTVVDSLKFSQQSITAATGVGGELFTPIDNIIFSADQTGNGDGNLNQGEVLNYLIDQKLITNPSVVAVPPTCTFTQNPPKYTCAS